MTRIVSNFSRAALATSLLLAVGCDQTAEVGGAYVDLEAMEQAELPMEQLIALTDVASFQVDEAGIELETLLRGPDSDFTEGIVVSTFGEEGTAVFHSSDVIKFDETNFGVTPGQGDPTEVERPGDDRPHEPRGFRLLWSNFTSGGLGLNGELELHQEGIATADVQISMGGNEADLDMEGTWRQDEGGADVYMSGKMIDDLGLAWTVRTDALRLEVGCSVASGGRWLAEAVDRGADATPTRFEVVYQEGCSGCADLYVNGTPIGRSCVGGN